MENFAGRGRETGLHSKWEPLRGFKQQNEGIREGGREERRGHDPGERWQCVVGGGIWEAEPTKTC